jgi:hypothetical protein
MGKLTLPLHGLSFPGLLIIFGARCYTMNSSRKELENVFIVDHIMDKVGKV